MTSIDKPSSRANGSRKCAPDDRLREAIHNPVGQGMDCFVAYAPRNDGPRPVISVVVEAGTGDFDMTLKLFELVGTDEARPFSPFCWRTRMALAHKGLSAQSIPWCFTEKDAIAPHN